MQFVEKVYSWISQRKGETSDSLGTLNSHRLIKLANEINYLFMEVGTEMIEVKPDLQLPQIVVVGTQSSGKSSVLNRLMNMKLLPTGSKMVTRTPLFLRMHNHDKDGELFLEAKEFTAEGKLTTELGMELTYPHPEKREIEVIRNYIRRKTDEYAGKEMNISDRPIVIDLYSPDVPNLSLVDLPGLMMMAQPDKGQPADIREQVERIVSKYINRKKVIILSIIQAREDLETDQGLAFIKKCGDTGERKIVGVLTKPDLMNKGGDVSKYLAGQISEAFQLSEGYYVVKNSVDPLVTATDEGSQEIEYFRSHPAYGLKSFENRTGIMPLREHLSHLLLSSICRALPQVLNDITRLDKYVEQQIIQLGEAVPDTDESKLSYLHNYINDFSGALYSLLEDRGLTISSGKRVKDVFVNFRRRNGQFTPFDNTIEYPDKYFETLISNFEGNHMSFSAPHVEVLECCMMDQEKQPIKMLAELGTRCIDEIHQVLIEAVQRVVRNPRFRRFIPLCQAVEDTLLTKLLAVQREKSILKVLEHLETQESYIWSTDPTFISVFQEVIKTPVRSDSDFSQVRKFVAAYYETVKNTFSDLVPKIVMMTLVRVLEKSCNRVLYEDLVLRRRTDLLKDDTETEKKRAYFESLHSNIQMIKDSMEEPDSF